jgi:hypothetical protein
MQAIRSWLAIGACVGVLGGACLRTAPADGPASAPALDPWLADLQKRLRSTDAGEREAAQKQLAAMAGIWQQPEMLEKMAEATSDLELKNQFLQRAELVRNRRAEKDAMNLPPISLSVKNAGFPELGDALNSALDTDIFKSNLNSGMSGSYTLDVKNKPFWEMFELLQQQQGFALQNNNGGWSFYNNGPGIRNYAVDGPALLWPMNGSLRRTVNVQTTEPPQTNFSLTLGLIVDPRITVARISNFRVARAADELGHDLLRPGQNNNNMYVQSNISNVGASLLSVEGMGKQVALACDMRLGIGAAFAEAAQDDIQKNLNKDIVIGNRTVRISGLSIQPNSMNVQVNVQTQGGQAGEQPSVIQYRLIDANGKVAWSYSSPGSFGQGSSPNTTTTSPYRLMLRTATKVEDINLHFELKNVPLP